MYICAIDPGNIQSAYVLMGEDLHPLSFGKQANEIMYMSMMDAIAELGDAEIEYAIEMVASYGMPVGRDVFDTVGWIGALGSRLGVIRFTENGMESESFIYRKDEKMNLCNSMRANDATIKQALIDRFAPGVGNHGKGTKKEPGWFYGFKADIWAAYAVGVTYYDKRGRR